MSFLVNLLLSHIPDVNWVLFFIVIISLLFDGLISFLDMDSAGVFVHIENQFVVHLNIV